MKSTLVIVALLGLACSRVVDEHSEREHRERGSADNENSGREHMGGTAVNLNRDVGRTRGSPLLNNGWAKYPETSSSPLEWMQTNLPEDCETPSLLNTWYRSHEYTSVVSCGDSSNIVRYTRSLDIQLSARMTIEDFTVPTETMAGGYSAMDPSEARDLQFSLQKAGVLSSEDCEFDYTSAYSQVVAGRNIVIKEVCDSGAQFVKCYIPLGPGTFELVSIAVADNLEEELSRLTQSNADDLYHNSINSEVFIRNHCKLDGEIQVGEVMYYEMPTGVQYLVEVWDETNPATKVYLAIFKYYFEETVPFLVAHPFMNKESGLGFINMVKNFSKHA
jgi:hypothetical protein